jgi:SAM-dependent methyltransferase
VVKNFPPQDGVLFDIGGGNGVVAARLAEEGFQVILVEPGKDGAVNAKGRGLENVICASAQEANFKDNSLPAIGLFDVLEHIENDNDFLQFLRRKLIPEGVLYATVPAYQLLWSANDDYAGHFRRYTIENLAHLFNISGYQVVFTSHFFRFLPLVIFFQRSILYRLGIVKKITENKNLAREHAIRGGVVSSVMKTLLSVECKKIEKKESIRFGSSCLIVAKKSEK